MSPRFATAIAGVVVAIVAYQSLGVFGGGAPSVTAPASMLLALPVFMGVPIVLVVGSFVGLFWLWSPALFSGSARVPRRTLILLGASVLLSGTAFVAGWQYAVRYQGTEYAVICLLVSAFALASLIWLMFQARKHPSFRKALAIHTLLFVWLASYAVPYMGETP